MLVLTLTMDHAVSQVPCPQHKYLYKSGVTVYILVTICLRSKANTTKTFVLCVEADPVLHLKIQKGMDA